MMIEEIIYVQNGINGEKVLFDLGDYSSDKIREDYKNIRFYDENTNKLLKHYMIDNQGIKQFLIEIPPYKVDNTVLLNENNNNEDFIGKKFDSISIANTIITSESIMVITMGEVILKIYKNIENYPSISSAFLIYNEEYIYSWVGFPINTGYPLKILYKNIKNILNEQVPEYDFDGIITNIGWDEEIEFELKINVPHNIKLLIMTNDYLYNGCKSLFTDYFNYKENNKPVDLPGVIITHNEETILCCSDCDTQMPGVKLTSPILYTELLSIQKISSVSNKSWLKQFYIDGVPPLIHIQIGTGVGIPSIWEGNENINGSLEGNATGYVEVGEKWKISRTFFGFLRIIHYEDVDDLFNKATRTVGEFTSDKYRFKELRWNNAYVYTSAHLFMKNPAQSTGSVISLEMINNE